MAIVNSIILGRAKGSIGNVSLSTQKGRVIAKQKATIVANPNTPPQQEQRSKLAKAVAAWQLVGNAVKSGITALVPLGSEYNTYTSKNMDIFADKPFAGDKPLGSDLRGSYATFGRLGDLGAYADDLRADVTTFIVSGQKLKEISKAGDKIKVVLLDAARSTVLQGVYTVTGNEAPAGEVIIDIPILDASTVIDPVYSIWFETADGKDSTTSQFN